MISTSLFFALAAGLAVSAQEMPTAYHNPLLAKVLLFTLTEGFRHDSVPTAVEELIKWGPYYNISFDATEDRTKFTEANLQKYDAVMCVHTTGDLFDKVGQAAFVDYLAKGGNFAAIHAASVAYLEKPWAPYTQTLGATFDHHPKRQDATFVKQMSHPATDPTPDQWRYEEEVYSFTSDPRKLGAKILYTVDATSYTGDGTDVTDRPIAWVQEYAAGAVVRSGGPGPGVAGRSFYSSLGHLNETWRDPVFMKHVLGGLTWTFGSNTTWVASGLYGGAEPTVHTGASNNVSSTAVNAWSPVLGSNATAPAPPPLPTPTETSGAASPDATGGAGGSGTTSGATSVRIGAGIWAVVLAVAGAFAL